MAKLNRVGGIIMLVSLFLPVLAIFIGPITIVLWLYGLATRTRLEGGFYMGWWLGWDFLDFEIMNIVQFAIFILLLVFSIHCIKKDPDKARLYGILSIIIMVLYYLVCYALVAAIMEEFEFVEFLVVPHIGFFGIIIGSILNIAAK